MGGTLLAPQGIKTSNPKHAVGQRYYCNHRRLAKPPEATGSLISAAGSGRYQPTQQQQEQLVGLTGR